MTLELIWDIFCVEFHSLDEHSAFPCELLALLYFVVSELESHSLEVGLVRLESKLCHRMASLNIFSEFLPRKNNIVALNVELRPLRLKVSLCDLYDFHTSSILLVVLYLFLEK